jgi:hypothetical protein
MSKTLLQYASAYSISQSNNRAQSLRKTCQVCGSLYVATTNLSKTCEFCKSPFQGRVALTQSYLQLVAV